MNDATPKIDVPTPWTMEAALADIERSEKECPRWGDFDPALFAAGFEHFSKTHAATMMTDEPKPAAPEATTPKEIVIPPGVIGPDPWQWWVRSDERAWWQHPRY